MVASRRDLHISGHVVHIDILSGSSRCKAFCDTADFDWYSRLQLYDDPPHAKSIQSSMPVDGSSLSNHHLITVET